MFLNQSESKSQSNIKIWHLSKFFEDIKIVHPVHLHGHHFHVLKIGYPPFDPITGNSTARSPDIQCLNDGCSEATWADPSWMNGNIPGLNLMNPPIKDTVSVPAHGYVIIRFVADNPGTCSWSLNHSRLFCYNLVHISKLTWGSFCNMTNFNSMLICLD